MSQAILTPRVNTVAKGLVWGLRNYLVERSVTGIGGCRYKKRDHVHFCWFWYISLAVLKPVTSRGQYSNVFLQWRWLPAKLLKKGKENQIPWYQFLLSLFYCGDQPFIHFKLQKITFLLLWSYFLSFHTDFCHVANWDLDFNRNDNRKCERNSRWWRAIKLQSGHCGETGGGLTLHFRGNRIVYHH